MTDPYDWSNYADKANAKRRTKYRTDPDYAEAANRRAKASYEKKRRARVEKMLDGAKPEGETHDIIKPNGTTITLHGMDALASYCSVTTTTLRTWLKSGVLPEPTLRIGRRNWFSMEYLNMVRNAIMQLGTTRLNSDKIKAERDAVIFSEYALISGGEDSIRKHVESK